MRLTIRQRVRYAALFAWCKLRRHVCYWDRGSFACDNCSILSLEQFREKYIRPAMEAALYRALADNQFPRGCTCPDDSGSCDWCGAYYDRKEKVADAKE